MIGERLPRMIFPNSTFFGTSTCLLVLAIGSLTADANEPANWRAGNGSWTDASHWENGLPTDLRTAFLNGASDIVVPVGRSAAGMMRIGTRPGDDVRLRVRGELIARRDFVQVAEHSGGKATIELDDGAFHAVSAVYVGGANEGPDRACVANVTVRGGSFLARVLTLGWASGSRAMFHVEGSQASAVHLLDALMIGVEQKHASSDSTLAFTFDEHGVTPITIASRSQGLSITPGSAKSRASLRIALSAIPPRDDVTLIALRRPARGTFDGLPEGAKVSASFAGREYSWTLTYRGGASKCDVVLTNVAGHAADAPKTKCRSLPNPPRPLWLEVNSRSTLPDKWEPAFDGAEGFGSMARGGREGREIVVSNLNDSGPGSLREALSAKEPRRVRFSVGGEIALKTRLDVREPFLTLDGSTAPAPGITLRGRGMSVMTHDVILRHFRIRPGVPSSESEDDALEFSGAERCIADHLSLAWATDETLSVVGLSDCISVQWCVIAEPLNDRKHAYGSIIGGERTTWHHNLFAHCVSRVPRFASIATCDFRNNVLYDWGHTAGYGQFERVNYIANFLKPGPSTTQHPPQFHNGDSVIPDRSLHLSGNIMFGLSDLTQANHMGVGFDPAVLSEKPFPFPPVTTDSAAAAYQQVLNNVGATLPLRDSTDKRLLRQVRDGTGRIVDRVPE